MGRASVKAASTGCLQSARGTRPLHLPTSLVSSVLPEGGWGCRGWVPRPQGVGSTRIPAGQALSALHPAFPSPAHWRAQHSSPRGSYQTTRRCPLPPSAPPPRQSAPHPRLLRQQDRSRSGGTGVLGWFQASACDREASFSFHSRPAGISPGAGLGCSQAEGTAGCHWALSGRPVPTFPLDLGLASLSQGSPE